MKLSIRLSLSLVLPALVVLQIPGIALAQDPGALNKNQQETREYYELLQKERDTANQEEQPALVEKPDEPEAPKAPAETRRILVTSFEVSSSEVLSEEQIAAVTNQYVNKELNIADIQGVVGEINALYAEQSNIVARAVLPKQNVQGGVIKIQLIEARLGAVRVEGNEHTGTRFIEKRVAPEEGALVDLKDLEADLLKFNRVNDMALRANLAPGKEYGTTDIVVLAQEPQNVTFNAFTDNAGRETVGQARLGAGFQVNSLFGIRDRLSLGGTASEGSSNFYGSYDVPVHRSGTRVAAFFDSGDIEIVDGPLKELNITGESSNGGLTITQPLMVRQSWDWDASLGYTHKTSDSFFDGVKLVNTQADLATLGTNLRFFDKSGTWLTSHAFSFGKSDSVEGRDYFIYDGSLIRLQYFQNGSSLIFRTNWQLSDTNDLPSFDQIIIGGTATVRGYSEGILAGDQGYVLSAEYAYPMNFIGGDWAQRKNVFVFFDNGAAFPFRGDSGSDSTSEDFLASVGIGLDFDIWQRVSFKVSLGVPLLDDREIDQDNYKVHAIFNWNVF